MEDLVESQIDPRVVYLLPWRLNLPIGQFYFWLNYFFYCGGVGKIEGKKKQ